MRFHNLLSTTVANSPGRNGPTLIAAGLAIQIAATWLPAAPAVSAMALVALGATGVMIERFRRTPAFSTLVISHLALYGSLYLVYVGAVWHAAAASSRLAVPFWTWLDIAASIGLMGLVVRSAAMAMRAASGGEDIAAH